MEISSGDVIACNWEWCVEVTNKSNIESMPRLQPLVNRGNPVFHWGFPHLYTYELLPGRKGAISLFPSFYWLLRKFKVLECPVTSPGRGEVVFVFGPTAENGSDFTQRWVPQGLVSSALTVPAPLWSLSATTRLIYVTNLLSTNYQTPCSCLAAVSLQIDPFISSGVTRPTSGINDTVSLTDII